MNFFLPLYFSPPYPSVKEVKNDLKMYRTSRRSVWNQIWEGNREINTVFMRFTRRTGMHAISNIAYERSRFNRIVWTLLLLLALMVLVLQIYFLTTKLRSHLTSTKTSISFQSPMIFPAITFCNLNPVKLQKLKESGKGEVPQEASMGKVTHRRRGSHDRKMKRKHVGLHAIKTFVNANAAISAKNSSIDKRRERLLYLMGTLDENEYLTVTYSIRDLLFSCSFLGSRCYPADFLEIKTLEYGTCFIFNSGLNSGGRQIPLRRVNSGGSINDLELTLFVDQDSYLPNLSLNAGFKILIHDQKEVPLPDQDGYIVAPGRLTSFGVRKSTLQRAKFPYGLCKDFSRAENDSMNMFVDHLPITEPSLKVCLRTCEQLMILKRCHCFSLHHGYADGPAFNTEDSVSRHRPCEVTSGSVDFNCTREIVAQMSASNSYCKSSMCRFHQCVSHQFQVSQSSTLWPADSSLVSVITATVKRIRSARLERNVTSQFVERNLVKVQVFLEDLTVVKMETTPAYALVDFASDLGGQAGLWLGMSAFTALELMVLIFQLGVIATRCGKSKEESKMRKEWKNEEEIISEADFFGGLFNDRGD